MKLFSDHPEGNLKRALALVAQVVDERGGAPEGAPREAPSTPGQTFVVPMGGTDAQVSIEPSKNPLEEGVLRVAARVARLPTASCEPLYRSLLEANGTGLGGAALGVSGEYVIIVAERTLADLDAASVHAMLDGLSRLADRFTGELERRFGASRPSEPPAG